MKSDVDLQTVTRGNFGGTTSKRRYRGQMCTSTPTSLLLSWTVHGPGLEVRCLTGSLACRPPGRTSECNELVGLLCFPCLQCNGTKG